MSARHEEHFSGEGYNEQAEDHGVRGWRRGDFSRGVPAAGRSGRQDDPDGELSLALNPLREPRARHDPGRVLVDMAVAVADGATTISEIAVLGEQRELFGDVASDSTCWRLLDQITGAELAGVARARAAAREVVVGPVRRGHRVGVRAGVRGRTRAVRHRRGPGRLGGDRALGEPGLRDQHPWLTVIMFGVGLLAHAQMLVLDGRWPRPNRRSCATACTWPPASSAAMALADAIADSLAWRAQVSL